MKNYIIILLTFFISACSNSPKKETVQSNEIIQPITDDLSGIRNVDVAANTEILEIVSNNGIGDNALPFNRVESDAVIIGNKIELLDKSLQAIEDISDLSGNIVEITGVSDSLFNDEEDICDAFWYVKIKTKTYEGILNGSQVYKIVHSEQGATSSVGDREIEILTTECLKVGIEYDGDLVDCPVYQPIVIEDEQNSIFGLVNLINNDFSEEAIGSDDFPFLQLRNDGGRSDHIDSMEITDSTIIINITRMFQEGRNEYDVLLKYDGANYTAEYLNYGEVKYDY